MSEAFEGYIMEMVRNPPDPNEPLPLSNRPSTIYGATIPFHLLSWAAVLFRLHVRFRVVKEPGWDDYVIILSILFNLVGVIALFCTIPNGLGHHLLYVGEERLMRVMQFLYPNIGSYHTCAGLVKISLLCQYLRLFKKGALHKICLVLLVIVCMWSMIWFIQGWFPCFPPSGFWNRAQQPPPKCWGTGFGTVNGALMSMYAFASSNMILDTIIFTIPTVVYLRPGLCRRDVLALLALFSLGGVVVLMAILRLWTMTKQKSSSVTISMDFTWWYPLTLIIANLEIDFAIICASIPIFWPVIVAALPQIFVTQEVHVTHERIEDYELERPNSLKSHTSQEGLTRVVEPGKTDYSDQFVVDHVIGNVPTKSEVVVGFKHKKWYR